MMTMTFLRVLVSSFTFWVKPATSMKVLACRVLSSWRGESLVMPAASSRVLLKKAMVVRSSMVLAAGTGGLVRYYGTIGTKHNLKSGLLCLTRGASPGLGSASG